MGNNQSSSSLTNVSQSKTKQINKEKTVSVAECATGGALMSLFTDERGCSKYYKGGINTYTIDMKVNILGINRDHAETVDCVSIKVAKEMSLGIMTLCDSDYGISTTGYSEKYPPKDVKQAYILYSICHKNRFGDYMYNTGEIKNTQNLNRKKFKKYVAKCIYDLYKDLYAKELSAKELL